MRAGEVCIREVVTAERGEAVVDAARRMAEHGVGDLIVVARDGKLVRPIGIVTDRDLVLHVLARPDKNPSKVTVGDVMQPQLVTAVETDELDDVLVKLRRHAIRRIPIVDAQGGLQGVVSLDDVIEWIYEQMRAVTALVEQQGVRPDIPVAR